MWISIFVSQILFLNNPYSHVEGFKRFLKTLLLTMTSISQGYIMMLYFILTMLFHNKGINMHTTQMKISKSNIIILEIYYLVPCIFNVFANKNLFCLQIQKNSTKGPVSYQWLMLWESTFVGNIGPNMILSLERPHVTSY